MHDGCPSPNYSCELYMKMGILDPDLERTRGLCSGEFWGFVAFMRGLERIGKMYEK